METKKEIIKNVLAQTIDTLLIKFPDHRRVLTEQIYHQYERVAHLHHEEKLLKIRQQHEEKLLKK